MRFAWSDDRADIASRDAANANPAIDRQDWSDIRVSAGQIYIFVDEDDTGGLHRQSSNPTTCGNNKGAP